MAKEKQRISGKNQKDKKESPHSKGKVTEFRNPVAKDDDVRDQKFSKKEQGKTFSGRREKIDRNVPETQKTCPNGRATEETGGRKRPSRMRATKTEDGLNISKRIIQVGNIHGGKDSGTSAPKSQVIFTVLVSRTPK